MTLDHRLIAMLVCPLCKGPLEAGHDADNRLVELECAADKLAFPIHDGIPASARDRRDAHAAARLLTHEGPTA